MRGPKTMAMTILAFFGCSLLAIQLKYQPSTPTAGALGPPEPPVQVQPGAPTAGALGPPEPPVLRSAAAAPAESPIDLPEPSSPGELGVAPVPAPLDRERRLSECIERNVHGRGHDDVKPTLSARRPVLQRAREAQRLRRLEVKAMCERELAPASGAPAHAAAG